VKNLVYHQCFEILRLRLRMTVIDGRQIKADAIERGMSATSPSSKIGFIVAFHNFRKTTEMILLRLAQIVFEMRVVRVISIISWEFSSRLPSDELF